MTKLAIAAAASLMLLALPVPANAAVNIVTNGSFETLPGTGLPFGCGVDCSFSIGPIPGWITNGATGQFQPGPPSTTTFFSSVPDGVTVAYSNGGSISQTLGITAVAGQLYNFSVAFGRRSDGTFDPTATAVLNVGNNFVIATGVAPTPGNWSTYMASYLATALDAGAPISVVLNASGAQGNWDDVNVSAVPEPATWAMMLLGFGIVGGAMRSAKRRQKATVSHA